MTPIRAAGEEYGAAMARSVEAAGRHDQLATRLHAIDSARAFLRLLFAVEGRPVPQAEDIPEELAEVEAAQDWPAGYLRWVLLLLLRDPAPRRQLELARRVNRLLEQRGLPRIPELEAPPADPRRRGEAAAWRPTAAGT